jgi:peptidoglycan hydrolase-like protein with peptidoglycan-binding domain
VSASRLVQRLTLVAVLVIGLIGLGIGVGLGGLESRFTSASDNLGMLPATRLTALPHQAIADGTVSLRVRLSGRPASFSPRPELSPTVAGTWTTRGDSEIFTPTSTLDPCATYTLTIPAASTAISHSPLATQRDVTLQVACPSVKGLQQTLSRLDYLPYSARSSPRVSDVGGASSVSATTGETSARLDRRRIAAIDAFDPSSAPLHARVANAPPLEYGQLDETTKGAVMVFQAAHEIEPTGTPEAATWKALLRAAERDERNRSPYTFVTVSESIPETLEVHRDNHVVLSTPANTGVPGAETAQGIFPIFSRFVSTTMVGTDPDGTKYTAPDVPWVNYFNGGDAVHGYPRASYGSPQSNGCVELPIETAHTVYEMLKIGDIVEVMS